MTDAKRADDTRPSEAATPKVCVIGSVNMDLVVRAPRIPGRGETVMGRSFATFPGGKGANQAVAAARMGAQVSLVGATGNDAHGETMEKVLHAEGIDLSRLVIREGVPTGVGLITVDDEGENTIVVAPGANATVTPEEIAQAENVIRWADVVLMQLETPIEAVMAAARLARSAGKAVVLNAAPARPLGTELLKLLDVLVVNRTEGAIVGGLDDRSDPGRLALRLAEIGPATVVLTLGAQGSIVAHKGRPKRIGTLPVSAVDAVGAGDAFAGALAVEWASVHAATKTRGADDFKLVEAALVVASAAGALAATTQGAIPSLPSRNDVLAAASRLDALMKSQHEPRR